MKLPVNFEEICAESNSNEIVFIGYFPKFDRNKKYKFVFRDTSVDISPEPPGMTDFRDALEEELYNTYGISPYNINEVKKTLRGKKYFEITFDRE